MLSTGTLLDLLFTDLLNTKTSYVQNSVGTKILGSWAFED